MALNSRVRAKSARERRVIHEYSQNQNSGNNKDFVIGNFLESLSNVDRKTEPRIRYKPSFNSGYKMKLYMYSFPVYSEKAAFIDVKRAMEAPFSVLYSENELGMHTGKCNIYHRVS